MASLKLAVLQIEAINYPENTSPLCPEWISPPFDTADIEKKNSYSDTHLSTGCSLFDISYGLWIDKLELGLMKCTLLYYYFK